MTTPYEPFADVGTDGKADADETGYDAVTNPDPAGDDYHALRNPRGTERDLDREEGEPYQDVGLDGVAGTCQHGATPPAGVSACWDTGEGDGRWTRSPGLDGCTPATSRSCSAASTPPSSARSACGSTAASATS